MSVRAGSMRSANRSTTDGVLSLIHCVVPTSPYSGPSRRTANVNAIDAITKAPPRARWERDPRLVDTVLPPAGSNAHRPGDHHRDRAPCTGWATSRLCQRLQRYPQTSGSLGGGSKLHHRSSGGTGQRAGFRKMAISLLGGGSIPPPTPQENSVRQRFGNPLLFVFEDQRSPFANHAFDTGDAIQHQATQAVSIGDAHVDE